MVRARNFEPVASLDMESQILASLSKVKWYAGRLNKDDDYADRLNHTFTSFLLVIFTLIISARQYIGKPIACWVPTEFTRAQEEYAESVCWVTSTYFIEPAAHNIPKSLEQREGGKLLYYQWVPFILMGQAFLFNIPCIIWRLFNWQSGINLDSIMQVACDMEIIKDRECRKQNVTYIANHLDQCFSSRNLLRQAPHNTVRKPRCNLNCCSFKTNGVFLWYLYLLSKFLYISNILLQFFLMNRILGTDYTFFGFQLLRELIEGRMWHQSGHFPRITMCDFIIRKLANNHRYTVQCVLPINMFNEKIFIFLWFWFLLLLTISISSSFYWLYRVSFQYNRFVLVTEFLKLRHKPSHEPLSKKTCIEFIDKYLGKDGAYILRLLSHNAGDLIASEVCDKLWVLHTKSKNLLSPPGDSVAGVQPPKYPQGPCRSTALLPPSINVPSHDSILTLRKDSSRQLYNKPALQQKKITINSSTSNDKLVPSSAGGLKVENTNPATNNNPNTKTSSTHNLVYEDPGEFV